MLKFKKNWLYRYNDWCDDNLWTIDDVTRSKTLCSYFWGSFWNLVVTNTLYVMISVAVGAIIGYSLLGEGMIPYDGLLGGLLHILVGWALLLSFLLMFTLAVYSWVTVSGIVKSKIKPTERNSKPTQLGLIGEWVKAKKNKVCPMIEFED